MLKFLADGSERVVTIKAGTRPPAQGADMGDLAITLDASDARYLVVESGRFVRADGTILIVPANAAVKMAAFILPK